MPPDLNLATKKDDFRRPIISRSVVEPGTLAAKVSPAPSNNKPRVDDVARATASPKTTVTSPGGRYRNGTPVVPPKASRYVKPQPGADRGVHSPLQMTPASDVPDDESIMAIQPAAPRVRAVVTPESSLVEIQDRESPDPADSDVDSEASDNEHEDPQPSDDPVERRLTYSDAVEDPAPLHSAGIAESASTIDAHVDPDPAINISVRPEAPRRLAIAPDSSWIDSMLEERFDYICGEEEVRPLDEQVIATGEKPFGNVDRALIQAISAKVAGMTDEALAECRAGLHKLDCYATGGFKGETRTQLERGQQINLMIADAVHEESGKRAAEAVVRKAQEKAEKAEKAAIHWRRPGPARPLRQAPGRAAAFVRRAGTSIGSFFRGAGTSIGSFLEYWTIITLPHTASAQAEAKPKRLTPAERSAAKRTRAQGVINRALHAMCRPMGTTKAGAGRPSRPRVEAALEVMFAGMPKVLTRTSADANDLVWEAKRQEPSASNQPYVNAFRGFIGRTLVRIESADLETMLVNLEGAGKTYANDFRVVILRQAIQDQLGYRGYQFDKKALALTRATLDRLISPDASNPEAQAIEYRALETQLSRIASEQEFPEAIRLDLMSDTLARCAALPRYHEAVALLVKQIPHETLFAMVERNADRQADTPGHK